LLVFFVVAYRFGHNGVRTNAFLGACLVLAPIFSSILRRILSTSVSRWVGRISFPLYLVHSAVICSLSALLIVWLHQLSWSLSSIAALYQIALPATHPRRCGGFVTTIQVFDLTHVYDVIIPA
jgi:peptidoglycan/LPS O-acetylase OafA/YrhL